jgi:hypothetical protein
MKKLDTDVDTMIREALSQEDAEVWDSLVGEPSIHETVTAIFRGRNRWLNYLGMIGTLAFVALGAYCIVQYLGADDVSQKLDWGGLALFCTLVILAGKLWAWMEMERIVLSREIKRLELQIAHLSSAIAGDQRPQ